MRPLSSYLTVALALWWFTPAHARPSSPVPKSCAVQSPELKVARECFSGDMWTEGEATRFVGLDETSPVGLSYCYNALVIPYPVAGDRLTLLVLKDDPKGQPQARSYGLGVAALGSSGASAKTRVIKLQGLDATCYARDPRQSVCSKGFLGFGSTDLPFAITLEGDPRGYLVKGSVRDRARIEAPGVPSVAAAPAAAGPTIDYLVGQVRTRLVTRARADLNRLKAAPQIATRDQLTLAGAQFRYCRLALDTLVAKQQRAEPFAADEKLVFAELDQLMTNPTGVRAPALAAEPAH